MKIRKKKWFEDWLISYDHYCKKSRIDGKEVEGKYILELPYTEYRNHVTFSTKSDPEDDRIFFLFELIECLLTELTKPANKNAPPRRRNKVWGTI